MKHLTDIVAEETSLGTLVNLTDALESLASLKIMHIKSQVEESQNYFDEMWRIYNQLRVDNHFRFGRSDQDKIINKELIIAITSEGGFNGDIDEKLISWMLEKHDPAHQDIIIIGHHGVIKLTQSGVSFKKYFKLPESDKNINVRPLVQAVKLYRSTTIYYQTYVSLMVQDIKRIELKKAVQDAGSKVDITKEDEISEANYIFEPSTYAVVAHLERVMMEISLLQTILDSKLAQYAARFRSMSLAHKKAKGAHQDLHMLYNRTRRALGDEQLKDIINGMKKLKKAGMA